MMSTGSGKNTRCALRNDRPYFRQSHRAMLKYELESLHPILTNNVKLIIRPALVGNKPLLIEDE